MRTAVVSGQLAGEVAGEAAVNVEKVTGLNFDLLSLSEKEAGKALDLLSAPDHLPAWTEDGAIKTASTILDIINRYRLKRPSTISSDSKEGNLAFLATICSHVRAGQEVVMCLPAFPFKSPNSTTKVLGKLPDRAEEIALAHLNGLCQAITDVYPPGAKLTIISDGLVYNGEAIAWPWVAPTVEGIACHDRTVDSGGMIPCSAHLMLILCDRFARSSRQRCLGVRRIAESDGKRQGIQTHRLLTPSRSRPNGDPRSNGRDDVRG